MARNRTVVPRVERIPLAGDGDEWVEVKYELNTGENKMLDAAGLKPPIIIDGRVVSPIDWGVFEMERALIYITGWNIQGADGKELELGMHSIRALDIETFNEINTTIKNHSDKVVKEKKDAREAAKKGQKQSSGQTTPTPESGTADPTST